MSSTVEWRGQEDVEPLQDTKDIRLAKAQRLKTLHFHFSDFTNHMSESILEGVSEPQHLESEVVERAREATMISNDLTSTPSVFSSLVLGLLHDDMPILDESIPPMETTMAMVDDDAPPHGSIKMKMTTTWSSTPHLQHMSDAPKVT